MPENPTHPSKNSLGSNKKHGLLNKMRRGLKKLTITKTTSEDKNYEPASVESNAQNNAEKLMGTYERDHPKSATFKKNQSKPQSKNIRRTSALLTSLHEGEPLHAIEEEN